VTLKFINYHTAVLGILIVAAIYFVPHGLIRELERRYAALLGRAKKPAPDSGKVT
jgi:hypothetical protein